MKNRMREPVKRWLLRMDDWTWDQDRLDWLLDRVPLMDWARKGFCRVFGHVAVPDHCGIPEHDLCEVCGRRMPGMAPRKPTYSNFSPKEWAEISREWRRISEEWDRLVQLQLRERERGEQP